MRGIRILVVLLGLLACTLVCSYVVGCFGCFLLGWACGIVMAYTYDSWCGFVLVSFWWCWCDRSCLD